MYRAPLEECISRVGSDADEHRPPPIAARNVDATHRATAEARIPCDLHYHTRGLSRFACSSTNTASSSHTSRNPEELL